LTLDNNRGFSTILDVSRYIFVFFLFNLFLY